MRALPVFVSAFSVLLLGAPPSSAQEAEEPPARTQPLDEEEASAEDLDAEAGEADAPAKPKVPLPGDDVDDDEPEPALIPAAADTLAGHLQLSPAAIVAVPFGELANGDAQTNALGTGLGLSLDAGIGLSRSVVLGVWGQFVRYADGDDCTDCEATGLAGGAFLRYHLVQGVRFDPWLSVGVGYRTLSVGTNFAENDAPLPNGAGDGANADSRFSGLDFLRFQIGGDWYPARVLGVGPFIELDAGTYLSRPEAVGDAAVYFQFATGLRLTVDVPGK